MALTYDIGVAQVNLGVPMTLVLSVLDMLC